MRQFLTIITSWVIFTSSNIKQTQEVMNHCTSKNIEFQFFTNGRGWLETTYTVIYNEVK